jgi:hypothetical protein
LPASSTATPLKDPRCAKFFAEKGFWCLEIFSTAEQKEKLHFCVPLLEERVASAKKEVKAFRAAQYGFCLRAAAIL